MKLTLAQLEERQRLLAEVDNGYTIYRAAENIGMDKNNLERLLDNLEFRCEVVEISVIANFRIKQGFMKIPKDRS